MKRLDFLKSLLMAPFVAMGLFANPFVTPPVVVKADDRLERLTAAMAEAGLSQKTPTDEMDFSALARWMHVNNVVMTIIGRESTLPNHEHILEIKMGHELESQKTYVHTDNLTPEIFADRIKQMMDFSPIRDVGKVLNQ